MRISLSTRTTLLVSRRGNDGMKERRSDFVKNNQSYASGAKIINFKSKRGFKYLIKFIVDEGYF